MIIMKFTPRLAVRRGVFCCFRADLGEPPVYPRRLFRYDIIVILSVPSRKGRETEA